MSTVPTAEAGVGTEVGQARGLGRRGPCGEHGCRGQCHERSKGGERSDDELTVHTVKS